jgi:hypothetical protein
MCWRYSERTHSVESARREEEEEEEEGGRRSGAAERAGRSSAYASRRPHII